MVMGKHGSSGVTNTTPEGITTGLSDTPGYLMSVSATNPGTLNNGKPGDVIVGFFKVLHESFDGDQYNNEKYFMVTNGLSDGNGTGTQTQQQIRLTFDMGSSGITSLQRLSRNTGTVEIVPLTADGNGEYYVDIVLDGGTGDLFKYNTGAPFVGIEEVSAPSLVVSPETQTVAKEAGSVSFAVSNSGTGTMAWSAVVTSGSSWVSITSGASGTNSGTIVVSFTKNTVPVTRTATIQITADGASGSPRNITLVQAAPALISGDANSDGAVNVSDLSLLAANYGTTSGATWAMGDFTNDGAVNVSDLSLLAANYGTGSSSTLSWADAYAQVFGTTSEADDASDETTVDSDDECTGSTVCSSLGLSLIAGLLLAGLMLVKLEE
jgi:hypothetical protein